MAITSEPALTSEIAEVELYSTLLRKERGDLASGEARGRLIRFQDLCSSGDVILVACDRAVIEESRRIADIAYGLAQPILIRSLDLLHMASASVQRASGMVSADNHLRALASALNMRVLPEVQ